MVAINNEKISYTLEQLRAFVSVAEKGSYTLGARYIKRDRSTVREHLENLQISLNIDLFVKEGNKIKLTLAGERFMRGAKNLLLSSYQLEQLAQNLATPLTYRNEYTLAVSECIPTDMVVNISRIVEKHYPHINVNWKAQSHPLAISGVKSGEYDIAIVRINDEKSRLIPKHSFDVCYLGHVTGEIYVGKESALANLKEVGYQELLAEKRYVLASFVEEGMGEKAAFSLNQIQLGSLEQICRMLEHGGWAYLPTKSVSQFIKLGGIQPLAVSFLNSPWEIRHSLIVKAQNMDPVINFIAEEIKKYYE